MNTDNIVSPQTLFSLFDTLILYHNILQKEPLCTLRNLLEELSKPYPQQQMVRKQYHAFCTLAFQYNWPECIKDMILEDNNPFTQDTAQQPEATAQSIQSLASRDLSILQQLASIQAKDLKRAAVKIWQQTKSLPGFPVPNFENTKAQILYPDHWPEWFCNTRETVTSASVTNAGDWILSQRQEAKEALAWEKNWAQAVPVLQAFHKQVGSGILSRFPAFIWQQESTESGQLVGIPHPDPIQLKQLIGLDQEHQIIVDNTKRFLNNLPAHNVILYGDRGSGKSSTVKSLLHAYAPQGLRMVELPNTALSELPNLMRYLAQQKQHFIIFIDDLSFETSESQYKWLKAALEGGLSPKPRNVLVYVTSNRHHLIKETFSERREDEVHPGDSIQEKLSLADRFGLTIVFSNPDQQGYLQIVEHMAHQHHINIPPQELRRMALEWALWHNGHSGRTAKQFIDHLLDAVLD